MGFCSTEEKHNMPDENVIGNVHHIGIAVNNLVQARDLYIRMGYRPSHDGILTDKKRCISVVFLEKDSARIELISRLSAEASSPIDRFIHSGKGYAMYHIAYIVTDIHVAVEYLRDQKFIQIEDIEPAELMDNRLEVYMYHRKMGLVELVEYSEIL